MSSTSASEMHGIGDGLQASYPLLANPHRLQVWIDFDGTITRKDVLDELIVAFAGDDSWRAVEARWQAGEIGSYTCLSEEFEVLRVDSARLERFLGEIPIDPGAAALFQLLRKQRVNTAILSDGIESFIRLMLSREKIEPVTIRANRLLHTGQRLSLLCPHRSSNCRTAAAHCKCDSIDTLGATGQISVYIGDGRSDLCPARKADVVFAKNTLAQIFRSEGRAYLPFDTLHDVQRILAEAWSSAAVSP